jgi:uncharacterized metal-binding protein YceD (DUF177 family)
VIKVDKFKQFILSFSDLQIGSHNYSFDIENWFFDKFEYSEIKKGGIKIDLSLEKQERMIFLHFNIDGFADVMCDRCGEYYSHPLKGQQDLIIKIGHVSSEDEDDLVVLSEYDQHFDLSQHLYEYISLLLPMQHIHPADSKGHSKCNKKALEILEKLNLNHKNKSDEIDPRWEELKKLKFN